MKDKSIMIKLTPEEIVNIAKLGAKKWQIAKENGTDKSISEVCKFSVDMQLDTLKSTDPDRF